MKCEKCGAKTKKGIKICDKCNKELITDTKKKKVKKEKGKINFANPLVIGLSGLCLVLIVALFFVLGSGNNESNSKIVGEWNYNYAHDENNFQKQKIIFNKDGTLKYSITTLEDGEVDTNEQDGEFFVRGGAVYMTLFSKQDDKDVEVAYPLFLGKDDFCINVKECDEPWIKSTSSKDSNYGEDVDMTISEDKTDEPAIEKVDPAKDKFSYNEAIVNFFHGDGCGYCAAAQEYFDSIEKTHGSKFKLVKYEVWGNADNSSLMKRVAKYLDVKASGVPFIVIGEEVIPGFAKELEDDIIAAIEKEYKKSAKNRINVVDWVK